MGSAQAEEVEGPHTAALPLPSAPALSSTPAPSAAAAASAGLPIRPEGQHEAEAAESEEEEEEEGPSVATPTPRADEEDDGRGRTLERSPRSAFSVPEGRRAVRHVQKRLMRVLHNDSSAMRRQLEQLRATSEKLNGS